MGRAYKNITFIVKSQAQAQSQFIPFELATTTPTLLGVPQHQYESAVRALEEMRITDVKLRNTILSSPEHIAATNRYKHDIQTGAITAPKNSGGLLLVRLGLRTAKISQTPKDPKPPKRRL